MNAQPIAAPAPLRVPTAASPPASASAGQTALRVRDVTVGYGGTPVLGGVSFGVDAGEWLAVIGPNGSGKSTLLKAIVGALPFDGEIDSGPRSDPASGDDRGGGRAGGGGARRIGYVPQQPILPLGMTTAEYVLLGRTAHLGWFRSESRSDRQRVADVLDRLDLGPMAGRPVTDLSGGEGQRATLARALVQEASILVLDEPTSALDLAHQIGVLELIDGLRREHDLAVVTAMHDLTVAGRFADRLLLVAEGSQVVLGPPSQVLTPATLSRHYRTPVTVIDGPDGETIVVPLRIRPDGPSTDGRRRDGIGPDRSPIERRHTRQPDGEQP